MQETPHDKVLGDRYEQFCETVRRMYPEIEITTAITWEWAAEYAPELAKLEDGHRKEIKRQMHEDADLKAFDKAVVAWCKTQLKIYGRYEAWRKKAAEAEDFELVPAEPAPPRYEQGRLI